ncbi:MAG: hypothetical protein L0228_01510 [Planctomycetes bacterium]|nr:hypothetical protein [Planctomycetota bacterium]
MRRSFLFSIAFLFSSTAAIAGESTTIPLNQIWAYTMPGARDIRDLDVAPAERPGLGLLESILESSFHRADKRNFKDISRPGFAVAGSGRSALRAAHPVFADVAKPYKEFSTDEEVTIVFFSEPLSRYGVQIQHVKRTDKQVEIQYQLKPSIDGTNMTNFALIPLGKLPAGEYHVELKQSRRKLKPVEAKLGFKALDEEWSRDYLCKPFTFSVVGKRE